MFTDFAQRLISCRIVKNMSSLPPHDQHPVYTAVIFSTAICALELCSWIPHTFAQFIYIYLLTHFVYYVGTLVVAT